MKSGYLLILMVLCLFGCSRSDKIDISTISIDREINIKTDTAQTIDSIIIFNTNRVIASTGDSIFNITTRSDKRKRDSVNESLAGKIPNPFTPETNHFTYAITPALDFSVIVYDSTGKEKAKLVDGKFSKGSYEVYFAIYSVLKPGLYYAVVYHQSADQYFKLTVR